MVAMRSSTPRRILVEQLMARVLRAGKVVLDTRLGAQCRWMQPLDERAYRVELYQPLNLSSSSQQQHIAGRQGGAGQGEAGLLGWAGAVRDSDD